MKVSHVLLSLAASAAAWVAVDAAFSGSAWPAGIAVAGDATGPAMPVYDIAGHCAVPANAPLGEKICIDMEYLYRRITPDRWAKAAPAVQVECNAVAGRWQEYSMLVGCLEAYRADGTPR
jgi:hypothetical protein